MNEREILKRLVEAWDRDDQPSVFTTIVNDAKKVLAQNGEPEHPAVEAYRKWRDSGNLNCHSSSEPFLAGWKQALFHIAGNFDDLQVSRHLERAGNATPTQLP